MTSRKRVQFELPDLRLIAETPFKEIHYSAAENLLYQEWKPESLKMDFNIFQEQAKLFLQSLEDCNPVYLLSNHQDYYYSLGEEHNQWYMKHLVPVFRNSRLKKVVVLANESLVNHIQMESLVEQAQSFYDDLAIEHTFFDDIDKAFTWLKKRD